MYRLTALPIFIDEGIHIRYACDVWQGRFLEGLYHGKLLQILLTSLVVPWAPDPLWMSRFVTVIIGILAVWACYGIGRRLYDERVGLFSAGLYIICPFTLFYDRMALADGILSTFGALTLLWSISMLQERKKRDVLLLGLAMALGILTKVLGLFLLLTPCLASLLCLREKKSYPWRHLAGAYSIALGIAAVPLYIFFQETTQISEKSLITDAPFEFLRLLVSNAEMAREWLWIYWTPTLLVLGVSGLLIGIVRKKRCNILLAILAFLPILVLGVVSRMWFPRYFLFTTIPFLVLASSSLCQLTKAIEFWRNTKRGERQYVKVHKLVTLAFFFVMGLPSFIIDYHLWKDPSGAGLPKIERIQYIEEWPSGYGVAETARFLGQEVARHPTETFVVRHEMSDGTYYGLDVYMMKEPRISLKLLNLHYPGSFLQLQAWAEGHPTFVVLTQPPLAKAKGDQPDIKRLLSVATLERSYPKPGGRRTVEVYRVQAGSYREKGRER